MRETRLFEYASLQKVQAFAGSEIPVPTPGFQRLSAQDQKNSWAGLAGTTSWRIENTDQLVLEDVVSSNGFRVSFSSPLSTRPLVRTREGSDDGSVELFLSCFAEQNGCTFVHLEANVSQSVVEPAYNELGKLFLTDLTIKCIAEVSRDVVVGLSNGLCALVEYPTAEIPSIRLQLLSPTISERDNLSQGDDTSIISYSSAEGASSQRSLTSSLSMGLMGRLFRSPRRNPAGDGSDVRLSYDNGGYVSTRRRGRAAVLKMEASDPIIALTELHSTVKCFISMHGSGRIDLYVSEENKYSCRAYTQLPIKLSKVCAEQFLVTGPRECGVAVVMADEDPSADSLRAFKIPLRIMRSDSFSLSCIQIAKRDGPIDRVVAALFVSDDVVVATETGVIADIVNVTGEIDSGIGLPQGRVWTLADDFDQPYGLWGCFDNVIPNPKDALMMAHRFSPYAIAKALRLDVPHSMTRQDIDIKLDEEELSDNQDTSWKRIKNRAEQVSKQEEFRIRDMCMEGDIGIVVARHGVLSVLRSISSFERKVVTDRPLLDSSTFKESNQTIVRLLASHGVCQELGARYKAGVVKPEFQAKFAFMMELGVRLSENGSGVPLTDLIVSQGEEISFTPPDQCSYDLAIEKALSIISPGGILLRKLLESSEFSTLGLAANQCANVFRLSSIFAGGLSWLFQYRTKSCQATIERSEEAMSEDIVPVPSEQLEEMLDKAYGCMVQAKKWCDDFCGTNEPLSNELKEDVQHTIDLATTAAIRAAQSVASRIGALGQDDVFTRTVSSSGFEYESASSSEVWKKLAFWLMEKCVRLFESFGAPKHAASCALEGMFGALDREQHEAMRAAAFSRFMDAGELEAALTAILSDPFIGTDPPSVKSMESEALRDGISLLVNVTADYGRLQWLADQDLPGPLKVMCGHALERRARAAEALPISDITMKLTSDSRMLSEDDGEPIHDNDIESDYELVYSWHVLRRDESSAATAALEWAGRVSDEGLNCVRNAISGGRSQIVSSQQQARLVLYWIQAKTVALSCASSALHRQPQHEKYIVKSKFSRLTQQDRSPHSLLADASWISRRLLLAHAQKKCLNMMLSHLPDKDDKSQDIHYLMGHGASFLSESREGVRWVTSTLHKNPTFDNMLLCAELGMAWREEISDNILVETIQSAAEIAARRDNVFFEYHHLRELLIAVEDTVDPKSSSRQWYTIALESALSTSQGVTACPQWLIDAAAWGYRSDNTSTEASVHFAGDVARVIRALLRNSRPFDAAKLILVAFERSKNTEADILNVPHSVIDATVTVLKRISGEYPEAVCLSSALSEASAKHIGLMREITYDRFKKMRENGDMHQELIGGHAIEVIR
ncbi:hypothetical protein BWQ96_03217 [Gracilariopsis chorda]|uniref:Uncharacterized protein n=1 Tax=Gracilariopsis chorda TaxID=448386 RepID=A0A2V3IZB9_9FLOR|nr:hypothetical protein BWQ96_03217 [Gracilariopsis chorda]|eukprot:PXF47027.1 hypothetical protein BWQ96_03217 [Gracilariopsis chorda]